MTAWDANQIKQPGWDHVYAAFVEGAREARSNPGAQEDDFQRAADGHTKRVFEELDPESERRLREEDFQQPDSEAARDEECTRDHGEYDENAPLAERLRWHVPKSSRYGSTFLEDDLLAAAEALK